MSVDVSSLPPEATEELRRLLADKASDLFALCDREEKGFVTKRDMQRMRAELPLEPEQLEDVFDRLDNDGNGYLTLEEFTDGFGEYLGLECAAAVAASGVVPRETNGTATYYDDEIIEEIPTAKPNDRRRQVGALVARAMTLAEVEEEDEFTMLLRYAVRTTRRTSIKLSTCDVKPFVCSELGILGLVEDDRALREMWANLRGESDPQMVANFEQFLTDLSKDLLQRSSERQQLESAAKTRSQVQEEHLQRLQEEMEAELSEERRKIREEEARKERKMKQEWQKTLEDRDSQVSPIKNMQFYVLPSYFPSQVREALEQAARLQSQLEEERRKLPEFEEENTALQMERDRLQREVERQAEMQACKRDTAKLLSAQEHHSLSRPQRKKCGRLICLLLTVH